MSIGTDSARYASINKRAVSGTHVVTGVTAVLSGPSGRVTREDAGRYVIVTPDGFRCVAMDIMGAVTETTADAVRNAYGALGYAHPDVRTTWNA